MINKINKQLENISQLKPEWNGRGTEIPSKKCINAVIDVALKYIRFLIVNRLEFKQMDLIPMDEGGISLEIDTVNNYVEIGIANYSVMLSSEQSYMKFAYLLGTTEDTTYLQCYFEIEELFQRLHNERIWK